MPVDVSVIVPVYNPGEYIEPTIESLLGQTLAPGQIELIFVDDGSTDATPARLDQLAAEHAHVRVFHEPPSGWPGRPRNVGIDAAQGEYVYFVDHDDMLAPDAMESLVATARRTDADIVIGKMIGVGRGAPFMVFQQNNDDATFDNAPLMSTLTPHKLFRRAFLDKHGIRYPEGKRRLEDHPFVVAAYFAADRIAILADRVCYFHLKREGHAASTPIDPASYYDNVRESIDIVEANTKPGLERNLRLHRFLDTECLRRLSEPKILRWEPDFLQALVTEVQRLVNERFPDEIDDLLTPLSRARTKAVRAADTAGLLDIARRARTISTHARLDGLAESDDGWTITWSAWLEHEVGTPVTLRPSGDDWLVDERLLPADPEARPHPLKQLIDQTVARVVIRHAKTEIEWFVPGEVTVQLEPSSADPGAPPHLVAHGTGRLDPERLAGGRPLDRGRWELQLRLSSLGLSRWTPLGRDRDPSITIPEPRPVGSTPPLVAAPRFAKGTGGLLLGMKAVE